MSAGAGSRAAVGFTSLLQPARRMAVVNRHTQRGRSWVGRWAVVCALVVALGAGSLQAQGIVGIEQSGSLVIFPKVVVSDTTDTMIQLINSSNFEVDLRCFYLAGEAPRTRTDFGVTLTALQPTHWVVSKGRALDPSDPPCSLPTVSCSGAGFDPGTIPALASFRGELICVQTSKSGDTLFANSIGGQATLRDLVYDDVAQYSALRFTGNPDAAAPESSLCLGCAGQVDACPRFWTLNHVSDASIPMAEGMPASDETEITVVRCTQDLATRAIPAALVNLTIRNEFEQQFGGGLLIKGWGSIVLGNVGFDRAGLGSVYLQTEISTSPNDGGILVIARHQRTTGGVHSRTASSAVPAHHVDTAAGLTDTITLPLLEEVQP